MVSVSPAASEKLTPFTAATSVSRRVKRTVRSSIRRTGDIVVPSGMRGLRGVAQRQLGLRHMAGNHMGRVGLAGDRRQQVRHTFGAAWLGKGAARAEAATGWWIDGIGRIA